MRDRFKETEEYEKCSCEAMTVEVSICKSWEGEDYEVKFFQKGNRKVSEV